MRVIQALSGNTYNFKQTNIIYILTLYVIYLFVFKISIVLKKKKIIENKKVLNNIYTDLI